MSNIWVFWIHQCACHCWGNKCDCCIT
jgi:hypothetical protein